MQDTLIHKLPQVTGPFSWVRALLPDGYGSYDMSVFKVTCSQGTPRSS